MIHVKGLLKLVIILWLALIFPCNTQAQNYLSAKSAFDYFLKVTDIEKSDFMVEYFYLNSGTVYDKFWDNEFELNERIAAKNLKIMNDITQTKNDFYLKIKSEFGEYNFEEKTFSFNPFVKRVVTYIKTGPVREECEKCKTFTDIDVQFNNASHVNSIPLEEEKARKILRKRTNSMGRVDREIFVKVYFKLKDSYNSEMNSYRYHVNLLADIYKIEVLTSKDKLISSIVVN